MIECFVAVVDRTNVWGPIVESILKCGIRSGLPVLAFGDTDVLLKWVEKSPLRMPVVAVADTDAVTPSVDEGVFAKLGKLSPRCKFVYFSSAVAGDTFERLRKAVDGCECINRSEKDALDRLQRFIEKNAAAVTDKADWKLIRMYEEYVAGCVDPDVSTTDDESLAPSMILREMLRDSELGRKYILNMIPGSWGRSPSPQQ